MSVWAKLTGTQVGKFILGLTGVTLKNSSGDLHVRNNADSAFSGVTVEDITIHNNTGGFSNTIQTSASQTANHTYTLPPDDGSPSQVLATDGSGTLSWITVATSSNWTVDSTAFAFGSAATITMFTLPANAVVDKVSIIVDTAFDGTPTLSVGVNGGSASKYAGSGDSLLTLADRFDIPNENPAVGVSEDLEIYYAAGGATVGSGRVLVTYSFPA